MIRITEHGRETLKDLVYKDQYAYKYNPGTLHKLQRDGLIEFFTHANTSSVRITDNGRRALLA